MTRSYSTRSRRITRPLDMVRRARDPAITVFGFTCFRLVPTSDAGLVPIELSYSRNTMFAFVRFTAPATAACRW
jgi:hypothetical protein